MKKVAILLALILICTFTFCACGENIEDLPDITTPETTTVPTPDTIAKDLGIIMEVDEKAVTDLVYSKPDGKEIGQATFTYDSKSFVFRASKTLDYSDIHEIKTAVKTVITKENNKLEYTFITYTDGSTVVEWTLVILGTEVNYTLFTTSEMNPEALLAVVDATILSNK